MVETGNQRQETDLTTPRDNPEASGAQDMVISDTESSLSRQTQNDDQDMSSEGDVLWAPKLFQELSRQHTPAEAANIATVRRPHRLERARPDEDRNNAGQNTRRSADVKRPRMPDCKVYSWYVEKRLWLAATTLRGLSMP